MIQLLQRLLCGIIAIALFPVSRVYAEELYYWFDNDLSNIMQITLTDGKGALDCSALGSGIHTLGFYVEDNGKVSVPYSRLFYKDVEIDKNGEIIYDIIIDGLQHSSLARPYANETKLSLDLLNIEKGDHVIEVWATLPGGLTTNLAQAGFYHEGVEQSGTIVASFTDAEGNDVTNDVTVNWRDNAGSELATGNKISGLEEGDTVYYSFILPETLGVKYREERGIPVVVKLGTDKIDHALKAFEIIDCIGKIHRDSTRLEGATVTVKQYPNDRFTVTLTATSDADGSFSLPLIDAPTRFDVSCEGYIDNYVVVENLNADGALPIDIDLEKVGNKSVSLNIDYRQPTVNGPESSSSVFMDYSNVVYSVACNGEEIVAGVLSRGIIPLPDGIEAGTTIEIRVASATNAFEEVSASAIIGEADMTSVDMIIEEMGGIKMRNEGEGNYQAYLYNDAGSLVTITSYRSGEASFAPLADGSYRVVSIASASGVGAIASIDDFAVLGLRAGIDYVVSDATVAKGFITELPTGTIPEIGEGAISTLTAAAEFYADKTLLIADEFLTGTIRLNLSDDILEAASGATVTVSLPDGCVYEQGSLIVDGKITAATVNDNKLSFRLTDNQLNSRVRFSLRSEKAGDFRANAIVSLDMPGNPVCRVGEIAYHVSDYDVAVPKISVKPAINLSGTAAAFGSVEIFDGETMIAEAVADGNGRWSVVAELNNPVNLSSHPIWIRATRSDGFAFRSQPKTCQYDKDHIAPTTVTMINTAHTASSMEPREFRSVFSLDGQTKQTKSYYYWPNYPDFTFLIDFTRNDPSVISAVILNVFTESDGCIQLPAEYNEASGNWVTSYAFDPNDLPVNVDVEYNINRDDHLIEFANPDFLTKLSQINQEESEILELMDETLLARSNGDNDSFDHLISVIFRRMGDSDELPNYSEQIDSILNESLNIPDSLCFNWICTSIDRLIPEPPIQPLPPTLENDWVDIYFNAIENWDLPQKETTYNLIKAPDIIISPPSTSSETCDKYWEQLPNSIIATNIDDVVNQKTLKATIQFDNGYDLSIDLSNVSSIVLADLEGRSGFEFPNIMSYIDEVITYYSGWNGIKLSLDYISAAVDYAHDGYRKIFLCEQSRTFSKFMALQKISKYPNLKKFAPTLEAQIREHNSKALRARRNMNLAHPALGWINNAINVGQTISNTTTVINKTRNDWNNWESLRTLANSICDENKKDYYIELIDEFQRANRVAIGGFAAFAVAFDACATAVGFVPINPVASIGLSKFAELCTAVSNNAYERFNGRYQDARHQLLLKMIKDPGCKKKPIRPHNDYPKPPYPRDPIIPTMDPSGFVYEGVLTRPVEGVMSTLYFNPTTEGEGTVWNAEDYSQINPQLTDSLGKYGWDVPRGNWRVVFEKEGYETAVTEWLPVPPPQLDVNIGMRKISPATLKEAHAYEDEVIVEMDTYMDGSTLTSGGNIYLTVDGNRIDNAMIEFVDGEGADPVLASRLRIIPAKPIEADKVVLHIDRSASTYCGVPLDGDIDITLPVEPKLRSLDAPARFDVAYGGTASIKVKALPGAVAEGRTLNVASSTSLLLGVDTPTATFDADGYAIVNIAGLLPGNAVLTFSVEGYDLSAITAVTIGQSSSSDVAAPEASIPSGSKVYEGTEVTLTCDTPDAVIYYTIDGSCPCDPASTRSIYEGPITINTDMTLKAIAVVDGIESDIAEFVYTIEVWVPYVAAPEASIPSGSTVYEGTEVTLTCDTPDAVIYYTIDGSSPFDPSSTRRIYNGPIVIDTDMTLKAIAVVDDIESDMAEFVYTTEVLNSIGEVNADTEVKVYPIPAVDLLNIKATALGEFEATLTSTAGVVVMSKHFREGYGTLNVSSLPSGFYILTLRSGSSTRNIRVVKR